MKIVSDKKLLSRSQSGNQIAFGLLVERYSNYCYAIVYRIIGNETEAEDVVQEAFVSVWQQLKSFDSKRAKFTTWLYTIATRLAIDVLRKRRNRTELLSESIMDVQADDALSNLCNKDLEQQLSEATQSLTELQKTVFVLREIEEMEVDEVSTITGLSPKQIKDNLYVARKKIRQHLQMVMSK